jgi:hypothetical protein
VPERKVHFSLSQRGRVRVGVNDISGLYFPPPAPPTGRGVFVQALHMIKFMTHSVSKVKTISLKSMISKSIITALTKIKKNSFLTQICTHV